MALGVELPQIIGGVERAARLAAARAPVVDGLPARSAVLESADSFLDGAGPVRQINRLATELSGTDAFLSPRVWRERSASFGLPGLDLPTELGGQGFTASQMVKVFEHMGRFSLNMRDMVGGAHVRPLLASQRPEIRQIVRDVADGKAYVAIAITEKDAGSNMRAMASRSEKVAGGYRLSGDKMFNARLETATHVVVFAQSPRAAGPDGTAKLNAFVLPIDHPGLSVKSTSAHGLYANSFGGVSFRGMFVPEAMRLGGEGEGGRLFREHFLYWRLMQAAAAIGTGKDALEQAVERMRTRQAFGGPIGRFTHFQQELGEHTSKLHMASLLVENAARKLDAGDYEGALAEVAMAKGEGVEWALRASDFAMELHGAEGYSPALSDLGQRVRDLQGLRVADGTTHVMREEVVKHTYGADLWDMVVGTASPAGRLEDLPSGALERARQALADHPNALATQSRYDGLVSGPPGVGACPSVAAANLIQVLGVMSGRAPLIDLDRALRTAYQELPWLRPGRLSNAQVTDLLLHLRARYLPDVPLKGISVDHQRALERGAQPDGARAWTDLDSSLLEPRPNELKLISYSIRGARGQDRGRHFVLLKEKEGDTLTVVDPSRPTKDYTYEARRVELPGDAGSSFQLVRPGAAPASGETFTVNSVFTVSLA